MSEPQDLMLKRGALSCLPALAMILTGGFRAEESDIKGQVEQELGLRATFIDSFSKCDRNVKSGVTDVCQN